MEMVDSLDERKSSRSAIGKDFPNFEMLDAKIASDLKKIIQNSQFKQKVSLEEQKAHKEDPFLRGRQMAFMICDYSRVTGAHDAALDYADLLSVVQKAPKRVSVSTRKTDRLHDLRLLPSDWCS